MKSLTCEMCGSTDVVKQSGLFICQACGTKYSVEDAKKMMIEGIVEIQGSVSVDKTKDIQNYLVLAKRAEDADNVEEAARLYKQILSLDANNWLALYKSEFFNAKSLIFRRPENVTSSQMINVSKSSLNSSSIVLSLIKNNVGDDAQLRDIIEDVFYTYYRITSKLLDYVRMSFLDGDGNIKEYFDKHAQITCRCSSADLWYAFGDNLLSLFGEEFIQKTLQVWKLGVDIDVDQVIGYDYKQRAHIMEEYIDKINKYEPSYINNVLASQKQIKGKCYIATAVYGSYDCPQVWTLRRFRDYILAKTRFGRAFINAYYTVSPTLIKWFGDTYWFKKLWRKLLDIMVDKLNEQGIENVAYYDENYQYFSFRTIKNDS